MNNLTVRRIALVLISLVIGFLITWIEVSIIPQPIGLGTTLEDYGTVYTILTILSIAIGIGVWLDLWLKTEILPK